MRKRWWVVGASLVAVTGFGAWKLMHPQVALRVTCEPGRVQSYDLAYKSVGSAKSGMLLPAPSGQEQRVTLDLKGRWSETCVERSDGGFVLEVSLHDLRGQVSSNVQGLASGTEPATLESSALVELSSTGEVEKIHYQAQGAGMRSHVLRDVLSLRSFALKDSAQVGETWESLEQDLQGDYRADYTFKAASADALDITKLRREYVLDSAQRRGEGLVPFVLPGAKSTIRLGRSTGELENLSAAAIVEHRIKQDVLASTKATLQLARTGAAEMVTPSSLAAFKAELAREKQSAGLASAAGDLRGSDADARLREKMELQELGDQTWPSLHEKLVRTDKHSSKLYLELRAQFRLHPETATEAARKLDELPSALDARFQMLTGSLADAGTPESQTALCDAIKRLGADTKKMEVLVGLLGLVKSPTLETEQTLLAITKAQPAGEVLDNIANLALGNVAARLADAAPERSEAVVDYLLDELRRAPNDGARKAALAALGNTGADAALPPLLDALDDPDPITRRIATGGLPAFGDETVQGRMLDAAIGDEDRQVRLAALSGLERAELEDEDVLRVLQMARSDKSEGIRAAGLRVVSPSARSVPQVMEALKWASENDRSDEVRKVAGLALVQIGMNP